MNIEELLDKCMEGKAPLSIISEIEEELPDTKTMILDIKKDLKRAGIDDVKVNLSANENNTRVEIAANTKIFESCKVELDLIADLYARMYPDIEFFVINADKAD